MLALFASSALLSGFAPHAPAARRTPLGAPRPLAMAAGNDGVSFGALDGSQVRIGIIKARWHEDIIDSLIEGAKAACIECGVKPENIIETEVPGSFELPLASRYLALSGTVDAILPVGVLIKGDTYHFEAISDSVSSSLMSVGLQTGVPTIFGVLTVNTEEQAVARSTGANNHGTQWGKAAVEMALLRNSAIGKTKKKFFLGFGEPGEEEAKKDLSGTGKSIGF